MYGLTAMVELGLHYNNGSMQIKDIARIHEIPQHYLEQILVIMKKSGLVESYRGVQGGYALASAPESIRVYDILSSLEGRLEVVQDQKREGILSFFWTEIEGGIRSLLDISLEELILRKQKADKRFIYTI